MVCSVMTPMSCQGAPINSERWSTVKDDQEWKMINELMSAEYAKRPRTLAPYSRESMDHLFIKSRPSQHRKMMIQIQPIFGPYEIMHANLTMLSDNQPYFILVIYQRTIQRPLLHLCIMASVWPPGLLRSTRPSEVSLDSNLPRPGRLPVSLTLGLMSNSLLSKKREVTMWQRKNTPPPFCEL